MGNCCKKRPNLNLEDKISQGSQPSNRSRENTNKTKEKNLNNKKDVKTSIMILKNNRGDLGSREALKKSETNSHSNDSVIKIDKKQYKLYKEILLDYIEFRKKLEISSKEEKIYIVKKSDNEQLIYLYNAIINENDYEERKNEIIKEKINNFLSNKQKLGTNFKAINLKLCENMIKEENDDEKTIDLLNKKLCEKLKIKEYKDNCFTYINNAKKDEYRYLIYKNKKITKSIKIKIINRIFSLVEIIDKNIEKEKNDITLIIKKKGKKSIQSSDSNKKQVIKELINDDNKNEISLEISSKKEEINSKENVNISDSIDKQKKIEIIEVKNNEEKKNEIDVLEKNKNIMIFEEDKNDKNNEENKMTVIENLENKKNDKELNIIPFKILLLFNISNKKFKNKEIYFICNKNVIFNLIEEIDNNNKDILDINQLIIKFLDEQDNTDNIQNILQTFKQKYFNLIEKQYNFHNINKKELYIMKKEIEIENNNKLQIPNDFIFLTQEIFELVLKHYKLDNKEDIDNIFLKVELLKSDFNTIIINICETNNIYVCNFEENILIKVFNIFYLFLYISKEIFLKENILLEKYEFDFDIYLKIKKLNTNTFSQIIFDENNKEIGYFINKKDLVTEEKNLIFEEPKKELENEKKEVKKDENIKSNEKEMISDEEKVSEKEKKIEEQKEEKIVEKQKEEKIEEEKEEKIEEEKEEKTEKEKEEKGEEKEKEVKIEEGKEEKKEEVEVIDKNETNIEKKQIGLSSYNSNSYLNSLLQCFYRIPEFINFFIKEKNFLNLKEDSFTKEEIIILNDIEINHKSLSFKYLEVLYYLYHRKQNNKYIRYYSPKNFLVYIQQQEPTIFPNSKEISPKILYDYFIQKLKEELKEKENIKDLEIDNASNLFNSIIENEEILYKKYLNNFKFKNNSIVDKCFIGIKLTTFSCTQCKEVDYYFQDYCHIDFPLSKIEKIIKNKSEKININQCFEYYFKIRNTSQKCKKCEITNNNYNTISHKIYLSPKILVIFIGDIKEKGHLFKMDLEININEYLKDKNEGYKLFGMITYFQQHGAPELYIAYCYNNEDNKWYCFKDDYIYEVDDIENDILESNRYPYILFYKENKF